MWQDDKPTEKQLAAICNMSAALKISNYSLPETKGDASKMIADLKATIQHNISHTGLVNPSASSAWDDDTEDWLDPVF